jgi:hypothetical protein
MVGNAAAWDTSSLNTRYDLRHEENFCALKIIPTELCLRPTLQKRLVQKVLFVCNDYNSYTFEEDGECTEATHLK